MSEVKYIQLFAKTYWKWWLGALIVGLLVGYIASQRLKPAYEGSVSFTLHRNPALSQSSTPFYLYDGYYSEQAALLDRNNFLGWLKSPRTVHDVYERAHLDLPQASSAGLSRFFKVASDTPTNSVDVTLSTGNSDSSQHLSEALVAYAKDSFKVDNVTLSATNPLILLVQPSQKLIILGVGLAVLLFTFVVTLLNHYFTAEK